MTDSEPTQKPENPYMAFVKGGTSTQKNDEFWERRWQESEKRRDEADLEKKVACVPIEEGGGQLYTNQMTAHPEVPRAYVCLKYLTRAGEETGFECLSDIIVGMDEMKPTELTIILVCPRCMQRGDKHMQDCQLSIRQSNKRFQLVTGKGNPTFVYEDKVYKSAGMIMDMEKFSCPDCNWTAQIHENRVRPD